MSINTQIAKNTVLLYLRMLLIIVVQLYTVPIILEELGSSDYGLYSVIGGLVTMFSFIGTSLASGSQRFISYALGKKDKKLLKETIDTTVSIYMILALVSFILLEVIGLWFLNNKMNIPYERMEAANWIFHCTVLSFIVSVLGIPFTSVVIAYEKMSFFAYLSILECILKLLVVLVLKNFMFDKVIVYAVLILGVTFFVQISYYIYCKLRFSECSHLKFYFSPITGREMITYSGWNVLGSIAIISRQQGLNILLNLFFGTILNAAHSIAQQICGVLTQFINNLYMATRPQITKLFAAGEKDEMWNLVFRSAKLAFYLLTLLSVPFIIELNTILKFWLGDVPDYTVHIAILMVISMLIETMVNQIIAAFQAANKIRDYQLFSSVILLCNMPVTYILLKFFVGNPLVPYMVSVILSFIYGISILWQGKKQVNLSIEFYMRNVLSKMIIVFLLSFLIVYIIAMQFTSGIGRVFISALSSILVIPIFIWSLGLDGIEKRFCIQIAQNMIRRYRK